MTLRVHAYGDTDVGQVRQGNEDSFLVGDSVYAVADGMGGHLAGEVASATALEPIAELDGRVFADGEEAVTSLRQAVVSANAKVARKASDDPAFRGMGTTLTAAMVEGRRLHLAHVGDSRAYLLRDGSLEQITDDHTLVQHLINEGQITKEEAATHPQRSIITRAIGVSLQVDVDSFTLDLEQGDLILLCSDGLTGVVSDARLSETLKRFPDLNEATETLISMANEGGGPDNITVVLLRYDDTPDGAASRTDGDTGELEVEDGESTGPVRVDTSELRSDGKDWAKGVGRFGALGRDGPPGYGEDQGSTPSAWRRVGAISAGVIVLLALVAAGGRWLLGRSYYVGASEGSLAIYQGVPTDIGPLSLSWVHETTEVPIEDVAPFFVDRLRNGVPALSLEDARRIVKNAPRVDDEPTSTGDAADPAATATPTPSPSPTPSPTASPTSP